MRANCRAEQAKIGAAKTRARCTGHPQTGGCKRPVRGRAIFKDEVMAGKED